MKICRVHYDYPNDKKPGAGVTIYNLCKYIDEKTLIICRKGDGKNYKISGHVNLKEFNFKDKESSSALTKRIHSGKQLSIIQTLYTYLLLLKSMRGVIFFIKSIPAIISFKPDIIACHENRTIFHGIFAKYFLGSKFILHLHSNSEIEVIKNIRLLKYLVFKADAIFCLTRSMGQKLIQELLFPPEKLKYTSTGVNPVLFRNIATGRKNQLLAIGRLKFTKGYKYLIDAMKHVADRYSDYNLVIIGDGPEREEIEKQIQELELSKYIQLPGMVSRNCVVQLMSESKIFVMSSLFEGLPKVLLEAMTCETPAVITTGCNANDIIQGRGLVVEVGNGLALSEAIIKLIEDEKLWNEFSNNCRSICDYFNWQKVAENVEFNYRDILY